MPRPVGETTATIDQVRPQLKALWFKESLGDPANNAGHRSAPVVFRANPTPSPAAILVAGAANTQNLEMNDLPADGGELVWLNELAARPELLDQVASTHESEFALQARLRKEYAPELVRTALLVAELRKKGAGKFSRAASMWFDRIGLEQSTAEIVARHKAARFANLAQSHSNLRTVDLCCGIGGDSLALATHGPVTSVDRNPAALWRTMHNAAAYDVAAAVTTKQDSAESCFSALRNEAALRWHIDPDRRAKSNSRAVRVEDYVPGVEMLRDLIASTPGGAIKLSPAANFTEKFPGAEVELISLNGEAKEATLWFGDLRRPEPYRATVLPTGETIAGHPLDFAALRGGLSTCLFDPDPAVVRAGLVDAVAERLGLSRLDDAEEYLTGDQPVASGFVTAFRVLDELPNNERQLRGYFREHPASAVEIKCRHIPVKAEVIRKQLPLSEGPPRVVFFVRIEGKARIIIAARMSAAES